MIKKWTTVISWNKSVVLLRYDYRTSCNICAATECDTYLLNKLKQDTNYTISIHSEQPLFKGQKVELGIAESSLLGIAMFIYLSPLIGLFALAVLFQFLFKTDLASMFGSVLGGLVGLLIIFIFSNKLTEYKSWQPIILSVVTPQNTEMIEIISSQSV